MNSSATTPGTSPHVNKRLRQQTFVITLDRPERKNSLSVDCYRDLIATFCHLQQATDVKAVVLTGMDGNFCSGGDVHDVIASLVKAREEGRLADLLAFTRMTCDLVRAMRS